MKLSCRTSFGSIESHAKVITVARMVWEPIADKHTDRQTNRQTQWGWKTTKQPLNYCDAFSHPTLVAILNNNVRIDRQTDRQTHRHTCDFYNIRFEIIYRDVESSRSKERHSKSMNCKVASICNFSQFYLKAVLRLELQLKFSYDGWHVQQK